MRVRTVFSYWATALVFVASSAASAQAASPIPDFSGVWGRDTITYEMPASGPGPVRNTTHSLEDLIGDDTNPILKPWAAAEVKRHGALSAKGIAYPNPHNQCWPQPPPYILADLAMQMVQAPKEVLLMYGNDHEVRHVRLNGRHPAHVTPSWYGDFIGHYEGEALVIDTVGVAVKPLSMIDSFGTPYTSALHLVERYRLIDGASAKEAAERNERESGMTFATNVVDRAYTGKGLRVEITVEDPGAFTMPWSAAVTYRRAKGGWVETDCAENPHDYSHGTDTPVPMAAKPDF